MAGELWADSDSAQETCPARSWLFISSPGGGNVAEPSKTFPKATCSEGARSGSAGAWLWDCKTEIRTWIYDADRGEPQGAQAGE